MANYYQAQPYDWSRYNPQARTPPSAADVPQWSGNGDYGEWLDRSNMQLPWWVQAQNQYQYAQDSERAANQWGIQNQWQQQMDQQNMGMQEWLNQTNQSNWNKEFGWQQKGDVFAQDLANRQLQQQTQAQNYQNFGRAMVPNTRWLRGW